MALKYLNSHVKISFGEIDLLFKRYKKNKGGESLRYTDFTSMLLPLD